MFKFIKGVLIGRWFRFDYEAYVTSEEFTKPGITIGSYTAPYHQKELDRKAIDWFIWMISKSVYIDMYAKGFIDIEYIRCL